MDLVEKLLEENRRFVAVRWELVSLCNEIVEASLYWTGDDEEKNKGLKVIRTLAGFYKEKHEYAEAPIEPAIIDFKNPFDDDFKEVMKDAISKVNIVERKASDDL